jgi:purine catabolism regulator
MAANLDAQVYVVNRRCLHPWHAEDEPLPERLMDTQSAMLRAPADVDEQFLWRHLSQDRDVLMMDVPTPSEVRGGAVRAPPDDRLPDAQDR